MNDDTLQLTRIIAPHALTCFQCLNHGLPPDNIVTGQTCVEIQDQDGRISFACEDCFERLNLEIEALNGLEEDEPKGDIDSGFD